MSQLTLEYFVNFGVQGMHSKVGWDCISFFGGQWFFRWQELTEHSVCKGAYRSKVLLLSISRPWCRSLSGETSQFVKDLRKLILLLPFTYAIEPAINVYWIRENWCIQPLSHSLQASCLGLFSDKLIEFDAGCVLGQLFGSYFDSQTLLIYHFLINTSTDIGRTHLSWLSK